MKGDEATTPRLLENGAMSIKVLQMGMIIAYVNYHSHKLSI
jgi:hypothetical protein